MAATWQRGFCAHTDGLQGAATCGVEDQVEPLALRVAGKILLRPLDASINSCAGT